MTAPLVPAVIPHTPVPGAILAGRERLRYRPLPLAALAPQSAKPTDTVHALTAIDKSGRVAARGILAEFGWLPASRLTIRERAGVITVVLVGDGRYRVDSRGYLTLPLAVRRWCRLAAGDRLLLVADRRTGALTGYPLPVLDRLLDAASVTASGGDRG